MRQKTQNTGYGIKNTSHVWCRRGFPGSEFWRRAKAQDVSPSPKSTTGFSLVETIVAIAILTFAMVAPLSLAQRGLNASVYARDQITAFYLAQEAIEYARNVRDTNNLGGLSGGASWLSGLEECINRICGMDVSLSGTVSEQTITCGSATADPNCQLVFNSTTGVYGDFGLRGSGGDWRTTSFNRTLQITPVVGGLPANAEAGLVATVSWRTGLITKTLTLNERIFNWYPQ